VQTHHVVCSQRSISYAITILWLLTVINAFNFTDNMNGLCAGLGAIGALLFAVIAAANGEYLVATIGLLMCGALAGFLPWNFPNARAFLGDSGSQLVGYLLAVMAILPHFTRSKIRDRSPCSRRCSCWPCRWPISYGSFCCGHAIASRFGLATPTTSRTSLCARLEPDARSAAALADCRDDRRAGGVVSFAGDEVRSL